MVFYSIPFVLFLAFFEKFDKTVTLVLLVSFMITFVCSFIYFGWLVFSNVKCPNCGSITKTKELKREGVVAAVCANCKVKWSLGVRFSGESMS